MYLNFKIMAVTMATMINNKVLIILSSKFDHAELVELVDW